MSSNRIAYSENGAPISEEPLYRLAKGGASKPNAIGTCDITKAHDSKGGGVSNKYVLANMKPVARVQSRHRVSPSPRKIPQYKLDIMALEMLSKMATDVHMPLEMMLKQQTSIRRNLPRFR